MVPETSDGSVQTVSPAVEGKLTLWVWLYRSRLRRRAGVTWRNRVVSLLLLLAALAIFAVYRH